MNLRVEPRYLRVSLLSACNLNCFYCRPPGQVEVLRPSAPFDKVAAAIALLYEFGVRKVRFTGGEPTLYKRLDALIAGTKRLDGDILTAVTTNGVRLGKLAASLARAGLDSVNISLDTLDRDKFREITGKDDLEKVKTGIIEASRHVPRVKLNCVLMRGVNDDEADGMVSFAAEQGVDIRFIEYMPNRHSSTGDSRFISGDEVRSRLPYSFRPVTSIPGTAATYYSADSLPIQVGFISAVSHPFCAECDRLRLTADGQIYGCLFSSRATNLFDLLNRDRSAVLQAITEAMSVKRLTGCQNLTGLEDELPSFTSLGG